MMIYARNFNTKTTTEVFEALLAPDMDKAKSIRIEINVPFIYPVMDYRYIENIVDTVYTLDNEKYTKGFTFFDPVAMEAFDMDTSLFRQNPIINTLTFILERHYEGKSTDSIVNVHWKYSKKNDTNDYRTEKRKIIY